MAFFSSSLLVEFSSSISVGGGEVVGAFESIYKGFGFGNGRNPLAHKTACSITPPIMRKAPLKYIRKLYEFEGGKWLND